MRKLYCLIIFVVFMSVVACKETGNKVDGLATNDSVQVADTLSADSDIGQHLRDTPAAQHPLSKG